MARGKVFIRRKVSDAGNDLAKVRVKWMILSLIHDDRELYETSQRVPLYIKDNL